MYKEDGLIDDLVSIVTPVYNGENHLFRLLDSILWQTYRPLQLILVDDGSVDGTVSLAESYRASMEEKGIEFILLRNKHNCAAAAVSRGLKEVKGEFLIWPDSDDLLEADSISKRVEFLRDHPQMDAVRSLSYYFDEDGNESEADEQLGDLTKTDLFWDILFGRTFVCCGCYMLKSALFFEIYPNRSIPIYPVGQNFQMLLPYMYHYKCGTLEEKLYGVFKRSGSHSRLPLSKEEDYLKYEHYEHMIDELIGITGITDCKELRQIVYWKANRRFQINMRYHAYKKSLRALLDLILSRQLAAMDILRKLKWILHAWIKDIL